MQENGQNQCLKNLLWASVLGAMDEDGASELLSRFDGFVVVNIISTLFFNILFGFFPMKQENCLQEGPYTPSNYSKCYNRYSRSQVKHVTPFLSSIARTCEYSSQFPIHKVIKAVSKFFLLNQIEVVFLAYLIKQTNWNIRERIISSNADNVHNIIYFNIENRDFKCIVLYLMIASFTVKYYLNKQTNEELEEATKRCPQFKNIFQKWAKKHSTITSKINPRTLNTVYSQLYSQSRKQQKNFNLLVDCIIEISPAYNPEKDKTKKEQKKKTKPEPQPIIKEQTPNHQNQTHYHHPISPFPSALFPLNFLPKPEQEHNFHPFMPFQRDLISQQHIEMIGNSIHGFKGQQNIFMENSYKEVAGYSYVREETEKVAENQSKGEHEKNVGGKIEVKEEVDKAD